ncbi:hypothetical protein TPHA_0I00830 [Tetrapisispora phaffii CBS 4417]|uniref:SET domain-containing protein n=1 Tax=Tetrapisispora phaffii (strain ATCC 24235 / CBS 4417 / NBRC 1672 / NRRL Y-8282 / UCD 70-5) TaxID=1071381 RepID=G8BXG1_TETPH|nr:hypothetical protein TPHA_0I00830 [Tetrapisispora phaffii CBS 4417]CCE64589.1 hypothetical protein TPHA_0I00830 [Tetrapisispora phaffii CBS 4417]
MSKNIEDKSILEDASTLLMFSKSKRDSSNDFAMSRNSSISLSPMNNVNSNAKFDNDTTKEAAAAAAAALAKAATIPLPLKRKEKELTRINRKRSKLKENFNSTKAKEARPSWPVPDYYIVDKDDGIITCICEINEENSATIQCHNCNRWQHKSCYKLNDEDVIETLFFCNVCRPRLKKKDIISAKNLQKLKATKQPSLNTILTTNTQTTESDKGTEQSTVSDIKTDNILHHPNFMKLEKSKYTDKYVKVFIKKHLDDDWVIQHNKNKDCLNLNMPVEVKAYTNKSTNGSNGNTSNAGHTSNKVGLFIKTNCHTGDLIHEVTGEIDFQKSYLLDPKNHYRIWATPKPKVFFHAHWPIHIDARLSGNLTRFLRYSCKPNVELATIRTTDSKENEPPVLFALRALRDISMDEELHIAWQWDLRHPIWQIINESKNLDSLNEVDKYWLIHSVDAVLRNCECACGSDPNCNLLKVKQYSENFYKQANSKMNNRYRLSELLNNFPKRKSTDQGSFENKSVSQVPLLRSDDTHSTIGNSSVTYAREQTLSNALVKANETHKCHNKWLSGAKNNILKQNNTSTIIRGPVNDTEVVKTKIKEQNSSRSESFSSSSTAIASDGDDVKEDDLSSLKMF